MKRLENKKVIVTGGLRGIGKAVVKRCLEEGAIVSTTYVSSGSKVEEVKEELKEFEDRFFVYQMDVTNSKNVSEVMEQIITDMGGIDVLVNNAGVTRDKLFFMMSEEEWDTVIKTNLYGPFYTTKAVIVPMVGQKSGCIVNIASVGGLVGIPGQANYCASKFGVIGLTKTLAKEYATKNIRVNAVAPGFIETDMVQAMGKTAKELLPSKGVIRRFGQTSEIASAVVYLASEEAGYITGQVLPIDGGYV